MLEQPVAGGGDVALEAGSCVQSWREEQLQRKVQSSDEKVQVKVVDSASKSPESQSTKLHQRCCEIHVFPKQGFEYILLKVMMLWLVKSLCLPPVLLVSL